MAVALALAASALLVTGVGVRSAQALSCVAPPTTEQIVTGTATVGRSEPYLKPGDYAVVGRVTGIEVWDGPVPTGSVQEPFQAVHITPLASFLKTVDEPITVMSHHPGNWGYNFEVGGVYFMPLPAAEPPAIGLCEAVEKIETPRVDSTIDKLIRSAAAAGVPAARVTLRERPSEPATTDSASGIPVMGAAAAVGGAAVLGAVGTLLATRRRRSS